MVLHPDQARHQPVQNSMPQSSAFIGTLTHELLGCPLVETRARSANFGSAWSFNKSVSPELPWLWRKPAGDLGFGALFGMTLPQVWVRCLQATILLPCHIALASGAALYAFGNVNLERRFAVKLP
jgi:hypothetical protein